MSRIYALLFAMIVNFVAGCASTDNVRPQPLPRADGEIILISVTATASDQVPSVVIDRSRADLPGVKFDSPPPTQLVSRGKKGNSFLFRWPENGPHAFAGGQMRSIAVILDDRPGVMTVSTNGTRGKAAFGQHGEDSWEPGKQVIFYLHPAELDRILTQEEFGTQLVPKAAAQ